MATVRVILRAITRHATSTTAIALILETTWVVLLKGALYSVRLAILATVFVISDATTRIATLTAASALSTQTT